MAHSPSGKSKKISSYFPVSPASSSIAAKPTKAIHEINEAQKETGVKVAVHCEEDKPEESAEKRPLKSVGLHTREEKISTGTEENSPELEQVKADKGIRQRKEPSTEGAEGKTSRTRKKVYVFLNILTYIYIVCI